MFERLGDLRRPLAERALDLVDRAADDGRGFRGGSPQGLGRVARFGDKLLGHLADRLADILRHLIGLGGQGAGDGFRPART